MKRWLVVTLLIPRNFEDGISNFLVEQGAKGIEEVDEDLNSIRLNTYFLQNGKKERILRNLHRYLKSLQTIFPEMSRPQVETISIPDQDWGENWKRFFKPTQVTSRFVVKPPWSSIRLRKKQIPIDINPGMAFGTGTHATTKLCIQALEKRAKKRGLSVLDVGTGSGILSVASAKLGAGEVLGLDIDSVAVEIARENVIQNNVSEIVRIKKGNIGNIKRKFDVVVANIDFKGLKRMRITLIGHLKKQGFLILAGILEEEGERLRQHYMKTGLLKLAEMAQEGEWVCLTFRKVR
jgi:ribosomal protein L11 methyltransferase